MNRIKQLRNEKNINQDVLAKLLGLEIAGISKLETGRVPLKDEYIVKLAEYFGVSRDYLLGKSDIRNPEKLKNIPHANSGGVDTTGLDEEDLKELQAQADYMKWKKQNKSENKNKNEDKK